MYSLDEQGNIFWVGRYGESGDRYAVSDWGLLTLPTDLRDTLQWTMLSPIRTYASGEQTGFDWVFKGFFAMVAPDLTVPAGTYTTIRAEKVFDATNEESGPETYWYAAGIGLVQWVAAGATWQLTSIETSGVRVHQASWASIKTLFDSP